MSHLVEMGAPMDMRDDAGLSALEREYSVKMDKKKYINADSDQPLAFMPWD